MRYTDWEASVPAALRDDRLWDRQAYRLALYAADLGWEDVRRLNAERASSAMAEQLRTAVGSISVFIAEGERSTTRAARARSHGSALGSTRESRAWYQRARPVLGPAVVRHRLKLLATVARQLEDVS